MNGKSSPEIGKLQSSTKKDPIHHEKIDLKTILNQRYDSSETVQSLFRHFISSFHQVRKHFQSS